MHCAFKLFELVDNEIERQRYRQLDDDDGSSTDADKLLTNACSDG